MTTQIAMTQFHITNNNSDTGIATCNSNEEVLLIIRCILVSEVLKCVYVGGILTHCFECKMIVILEDSLAVSYKTTYSYHTNLQSFSLEFTQRI